jgi:hypothetical protein
MAKKIEFTKDNTINRKEYKKGDTLSVSNSIYATLIGNGTAKDFVEKKSKSTKED